MQCELRVVVQKVVVGSEEVVRFYLEKVQLKDCLRRDAWRRL
jgi:hypothetical protein